MSCASAKPQLGCRSVDDTAAALARVRAVDWYSTDGAKAEALWPSPLSLVERTQSTSSRGSAPVELEGYRGRVIEGVCECCDTLVFSATPGEWVPGATLHLEALSLVHTESGIRAAIAAADKLSAAILGDRDFKILPAHAAVLRRGEVASRHLTREQAGTPGYMESLDLTLIPGKSAVSVELYYGRDRLAPPNP